MNKTFFPAILVAAFMTITLFSCIRKGDDKYGGDISKSFFPLQFGRYVVYDVDSTLWDDFHQVKTLHRYQMRYTIADTFRDNEFRLSYRMNKKRVDGISPAALFCYDHPYLLRIIYSALFNIC